jgi:hypothetical protein
MTRQTAFQWTLAVLAAFAFLSLPGALAADGFPKSWAGKIITSDTPLETSGGTWEELSKKLIAQDRKELKASGESRWEIHFMAFFHQVPPAGKLGVVVFDSEQDIVSISSLQVGRGQTSIAADLTISSKPTPGKEHRLEIYFVRDGKPVVLARKWLFLK